MSDIIDISLPLSEDLPVWPGSERFSLKPIHRLSNGDHCNESAYSANIHTGTHIDVPWDFLNDGSKTDSVDLAQMIGTALVVWLPGVKRITPDQITKYDPRQKALSHTKLWVETDVFSR